MPYLSAIRRLLGVIHRFSAKVKNKPTTLDVY